MKNHSILSTLLCIIIITSALANADSNACWFPKAPKPCKPLFQNHGEYTRCILADNVAQREYIRQMEYAFVLCSCTPKQKVKESD